MSSYKIALFSIMYEILNIEAAFFRPGNYSIKDLATFFKTA